MTLLTIELTFLYFLVWAIIHRYCKPSEGQITNWIHSFVALLTVAIVSYIVTVEIHKLFTNLWTLLKNY